MINKKLMGLLEESKQQIRNTVMWNWFSLLANVVFIFTMVYLFED